MPSLKVEGQFNSVCVRLIVGGQIVPDSKVNMVMRYRRQDVGYGPIRIDQDGVAEQGFNIGDSKLAQRNQLVNIDITIDTPDGAAFTTTTSFTPRYPKN